MLPAQVRLGDGDAVLLVRLCLLRVWRRRHLSAPVESCHWPLPQCVGCKRRPYSCGIVEREMKTASQFRADEGNGRTSQDTLDTAAATEGSMLSSGQAKQCTNDPSVNYGDVMSTENVGPATACSCTYAQNCALIISEDPLLRPSLLAMSLGISEVHTVVVRS